MLLSNTRYIDICEGYEGRLISLRQPTESSLKGQFWSKSDAAVDGRTSDQVSKLESTCFQSRYDSRVNDWWKVTFYKPVEIIKIVIETDPVKKNFPIFVLCGLFSEDNLAIFVVCGLFNEDNPAIFVLCGQCSEDNLAIFVLCHLFSEVNPAIFVLCDLCCEDIPAIFVLCDLFSEDNPAIFVLCDLFSEDNPAIFVLCDLCCEDNPAIFVLCDLFSEDNPAIFVLCGESQVVQVEKCVAVVSALAS
ncbi:DNA-directed RNA polymerase II subunit RPB1-like [Elysia marginata]|uniref:DNA-directed RNA polymerase II subunit RPB1-like n=1 Tax=Elysia marginata TaxID=1093978 RepID=A0AAV4EFJ5_9GAST|nr:DNA-directed RNA polymerase II subunit RPB1-like [Elysia marginata]